MASTIKVNNIQNQCGANIANKCGTTITLGASGDTITLACGASQTGFGRTGTVDWDTTAKTASFTAVSGNGYFVNTTSGAITVTLPASPSAGDIVAVSDYASTALSNNIIITPNGTDKINGVNASYYIQTDGSAITLVYVDATKGWKSVTGSDADATGTVPAFITATGGTITCCGDYKIHTFTGPGTFTVCSVGNAAGSDKVEYIVVAGGGAGGNNGGGGGAGGFRFASPSLAPVTYPGKPLAAPVGFPVLATGYPIAIGSGGAGSPWGPTPSNTSGNNSSFSTITSTGGGRGADGTPTTTNGAPGGSGGGSRYNATPTAGAGNTPSVSPPQGNPGGCATAPSSGGGGGGSILAGSGLGPSQQRQPGGVGAGIPTGFGSNGETSGCYQYYAGGGGGATQSPSPALTGTGGLGGGGDSGVQEGGAQSGTTNTGGGGGASAGGSGVSGNGGSGIVIIRYKYQ